MPRVATADKNGWIVGFKPNLIPPERRRHWGMFIVLGKESRPMVLKWRGAVVLVLALVGLTSAQAPVPMSSKRAGESIMTVHENGQSLRCRVISSWRMQDGSKAYQLQTIDAGEMITIVEDGPATTLQEPLLGGKVKSLPMRIFHWGRNREAPPGIPTGPDSPDTVVAATAAVKEMSTAKDQVVWWEEKNGKRVSPMIVTSGTNPFEQPSASRERQRPERSGPAASATLPVVVDQRVGQPSNSSAKMVNAAAGTPSVSTGASSPLITLPGRAEAPRMGTSAPAVRSVVQADQGVPTVSIPSPSNTKSQAPYVRTGPTYLPNRINSAPVAQSALTTGLTTPVTSGPAPAASYSALTQAAATQTFNQIGPSAHSQGAGPLNPAPTTAAAACNTKPMETLAEAPRPTLADKIGNLMHPKRETIQPADSRPQLAATEKSKASTVGASRATGDAAAFSTAASPTGPAAGAASAPDKTVDNRPAQTPVKKDWRNMWGRAKDPSVQIPGQSLVEQVSAKPADILLSPEKFDPSGAKLTPKGINMNSYRGDPSQLMAKNRSPAVEGSSPMSPLTPNNGRIPLGAQSVLAANGSPPTNITYVPFPVATIPQPNPPPLPPTSLPAPPPPTYVNAFTPPTSMPGYSLPPACAPNPTMMAPGLSNAGQPTMLPPVEPTQYRPLPPPQAAQPLVNPAMDRRQANVVPVSNSELPQIMQVLRESAYPAQREWAAYTLATYDWRTHADMVQSLVQVAQQDPAATVRAACVYSLARMNAASEPVVNLFYSLRGDNDPRVRQEVEQALARMGVDRGQ